MLKVELVYVDMDKSLVQHQLTLKPGACVADALEQSGILLHKPELRDSPMGIFSKRVTLGTLLRAGDRIEIYRNLTADPKEKRRQRAKKKS